MNQDTEGTESESIWSDRDGKQVLVQAMSDYWLNNVRKMFKGKDRQQIQPILNEIKRRKDLRRKIRQK